MAYIQLEVVKVQGLGIEQLEAREYITQQPLGHGRRLEALKESRHCHGICRRRRKTVQQDGGRGGAAAELGCEVVLPSSELELLSRLRRGVECRSSDASKTIQQTRQTGGTVAHRSDGILVGEFRILMRVAEMTRTRDRLASRNRAEGPWRGVRTYQSHQ